MIISTLILLVFVNCVRSELFTSMASLEPLVGLEKTVVENLDYYLMSEMKKVQQLRELAKGFDQEFSKVSEIGPEKLAENPLDKFRTLKRLVTDWNSVENLMRSKQSADDILGSISGIPSEEDLSGIATAVFRLQDVYRLTSTDIASGRIMGAPAVEKMNAEDCFELGRQAYLMRDYYHCVLWMQEALSRQRQESPPTVKEVDILDYFSFALYHQGNVKRAWEMSKRLLHLDPKNDRAKGNIEYYMEEMMREGVKKGDPAPPMLNPRPSDYDNTEREIYEQLCRGEHTMLRRATVFNRETRQLEHAEYRITKNAWLKAHDHTVIARINQRLDDMTNLDESAAEDFQVANYGIGGHYNPHFDHATRGEPDPYQDGQGNRIATVLYYLSTPIAGGATVFLPVKVTNFATKNDALFWFNLLPSGEPDDRTRHAACPVLAGQKWVANKWVHERKQEFRRKCKLTPDAEQYKL